ncbi:MAG: peptidoglycan-binding protein [Sandaracinaceae bacterium]
MIRFAKRRAAHPRALLFAPHPDAPHPAAARSASLGDLDDEPIPDPVTIQLRQLQSALVRAGYDIGPSGVDGRWGTRTAAAFERFLAHDDPGGTGRIQVDTAISPQVVLMEQSVWNALANATPGSGGERQSRRPASTTSSSSGSTTTTSTSSSSSASSGADEVDLGEEPTAWWQSPWLWGGVALIAGAGIVFVATREPKDEPADEELLPAF